MATWILFYHVRSARISPIGDRGTPLAYVLVMLAWILAQNEECHDVATSPELALFAGFSLAHVYAQAAGKPVVVAEESSPVSVATLTIKAA